jgi:hypothetical protein
MSRLDLGPVLTRPGADGIEIDLDALPRYPPDPAGTAPAPHAAARHGRTFRAALVAAAVAGVLAGTLLSSAGTPPPPPVPGRLLAVLQLRGVVLDPQPSAVLQLTVQNAGGVRQVIDDVSVSGGGVPGVVVPIGHDLPSRSEDATQITVPLGCGRGRAGGTVTAQVRLREMSSGPKLTTATVRAQPVGRLGDDGALCSAADLDLPQGWREPARATSWTLSGDTVHVAVAGLPTDVTDLVSVQADGVLLPSSGIGAITGGTADLELTPPTPGCRDGGTRPVAPTGLQLLVLGPKGLRFAYLPLGPSVAEWLMDAYVKACPSRPQGPSAVRTGLQG